MCVSDAVNIATRVSPVALTLRKPKRELGVGQSHMDEALEVTCSRNG